MLSQQELLTNAETQKHIDTVRLYLRILSVELLKRGEAHDASKLSDDERPTFTEYTAKLKGMTYGSDEYKAILEEMNPTLEHHYANNRHHPEHHENGVDDMTLIDLVEMICDWKAATLRHADRDILKSIAINKKRFNLSPQLTKILRNTVVELGWDDEEQR